MNFIEQISKKTCLHSWIHKRMQVKYLYCLDSATYLPTSLINVWVSPRIPELMSRLRLLDWCSDTRIPSMARIKRDWGSAPKLNLSWTTQIKRLMYKRVCIGIGFQRQTCFLRPVTFHKLWFCFGGFFVFVFVFLHFLVPNWKSYYTLFHTWSLWQWLWQDQILLDTLIPLSF